jgi:isopenicillin N synthase-like dioxygenase
MSPTDPRVLAKRFFMGPNLWPSEGVLPASEFKDVITSYYDSMTKLAQSVLEIIACALPYGDRVAEVFKEFTSNTPAAPMRLLHYPPQPPTSTKQFGASAHTDFGAITLLLQDDNPGLQVVDPRFEEETWVGVSPQRDAYVVNIGDMLSMWTKGQYKSSLHRVLNVKGRDRYSIVYFFDGNLDCKLLPFDGSSVAGESITVEQHMIKRMTESYGPK